MFVYKSITIKDNFIERKKRKEGREGGREGVRQGGRKEGRKEGRTNVLIRIGKPVYL